MGVTIELQNLGDAELCREIVARVEHALSARSGDWRVAIAGSRASENWEMRVEGPNSFERSYTLEGTAGEHEPEAISRLILQLVPSGPDKFFLVPRVRPATTANRDIGGPRLGRGQKTVQKLCCSCKKYESPWYRKRRVHHPDMLRMPWPVYCERFRRLG